MQKFILIARENLEKIALLTDEERFCSGPDMMPWVNKLIENGRYIDGSPFTISGSYVTQNGTSSEGPFLKEAAGVSGFDLIYAENLEEATAIAQDCPMVKIGHCIREVRPLMDLPEHD